MNTLEIALVTSAIRARVAELARDDDTDEAALLAAIEQEVPDAAHIVTLLVRAVGEAEGNMATVTARINGLMDRHRRHAARAKAYRGLLQAVLEAAGVQKWKHPEYTVTISQGRPGVIVTDKNLLPDDLRRVTFEPDRDKIKQLLSAGVPVAGAELANGAPTLTIRNK